MMADQIYRFFSCVPGKVARRWGTQSMIGAVRGADGYEWNPDDVVAISAAELRRYRREYNRLLAGPEPALIERTRADYEARAAAAGFDPIGGATIGLQAGGGSKSGKKGGGNQRDAAEISGGKE